MQPGKAPKTRLSHLTMVDATCRSVSRTLLQGDRKGQVLEGCCHIAVRDVLSWVFLSCEIHVLF